MRELLRRGVVGIIALVVFRAVLWGLYAFVLPEWYIDAVLFDWNDLPQEPVCGSGSTCWRRLRDWQAAGVWPRLHRALLDRLGAADRIAWSRASPDSAIVRANRGARRAASARRTAARPRRGALGRSAMWWSTAPAPRWPPG